MQGPVTIELVSLIVTAVLVVAGIWGRIEFRIREGEKAAAEARNALGARIDKVGDSVLVLQKDLTDYKLAAARYFASVEHMKDVEVRLTTAIDRLTNRIENLPRQFAEILTAERDDR